MDLGSKIKKLRLRAGLTQEMVAEQLGVSFQTISKWENDVCAPDISMLPKLSVYFGVTIDELFDLTTEQRLHRIDNMLEMEQELPHTTFMETAEYLQGLLETEKDQARIYNFLAHLYYHRVLSDCEKVDKYAMKSMQLRPDVKNCQWLLEKTQGAATVDWNIRNHHKVIRFYKELIKNNPDVARNYLDLMDNLLADNRTKEAREYLSAYKQLEDHRPFQVLVYEGRIALTEHNRILADEKFQELEMKFAGDGSAMFEMANYFADQCQYENALAYYQKSFDLDKENGQKPIYTDALHGMAIIYEILGNYKKAIECYDEMLVLLETEFGYTEGEPIRNVMEEKQRLMSMK